MTVAPKVVIGAIRAEITHPAERLYAKVTDIAASSERQTLTLRNREEGGLRLTIELPWRTA